MSRHRAYRNRNYSFDDEYYEEDYDDGYEAGRLYTAYDAYERDTSNNFNTLNTVQEQNDTFISQIRARFVSDSRFPPCQFTDDQILKTGESAEYDVDITIAVLMSTIPESTSIGSISTFEQATTTNIDSKVHMDESKEKHFIERTEAINLSNTEQSSKKLQSNPSVPAKKIQTVMSRDSNAMEAAIMEDDEGKEEEMINNGEKSRISLVVVGHVDAGKSTLMGQLLVKTGQVSQKVLHKYEKEAREKGKASFYLAWIMDEDEEERSHGVTIDVAQKTFETESKMITLLDAPGHRDFIPKMISGACSADVALLVIPASPGEFESGFESNGQTKEHALLVKALGVNQILVAVNKLDASLPPWSQDRYNTVVASVGKFLGHIGFKPGKVRYVPVSGLTGENLMEMPTAPNLTSWYTGPTLFQAIDDFAAVPRQTRKPFRMICSDISASSKGVVVSGKILQGQLQQGNQVIIMPMGDLVKILRIERGGEVVKNARAGDCLEVTLKVDISRINVGHCLCKAKTPIQVASKFLGQVTLLDTLAAPVIRGTEFLLHLQGVDAVAHCSKLVATTTSVGVIRKLKPRAISPGDTCHIEITLEKSICMEIFTDCRGLGRFVLRQRGQTVGVGLILEIKK